MGRSVITWDSKKSHVKIINTTEEDYNPFI